MRDLLLKILNEYRVAKTQNVEGHKLADYIRNDSQTIIQKAVTLNKEMYKVKGSSGQGNWADIPWIAIFDKDITTGAKEGYYIVYLFRADMSGVYISLNQGWTYFKKKYGPKVGRENIKKVSGQWKEILSSTLNDFSYDPINLKNGKKDLARGYELGHICGKYYPANSILETEELVQDLHNLIGVYRELKGRMKSGSIEKTNDYLIVQSEFGSFSNQEPENGLEGIESTIANITDSKLIEEDVPDSFVSGEKTPSQFIPKKTDFDKKGKNQKKLGLAGELMVMNYEKEQLKKNGKENLAKKVRHVSVEDGDGAGHDVLSYSLDGMEKFIEVKTTTYGSDTSFYISDSEVEFSREYSKQYFLYRVYDFDKNNNTGKFFSIQGDMRTELSLKEHSYIVDGIKTDE